MMITCFSTRDRAVLRLLEHLYDARALFQTLLGVRVQVGAELRERLQLTELRVRQLERTGNLLHRLDLRVAADAGYRNTRVYRRTDTGVEQLGLEEDLTVSMEITLVGIYAETSPACVSMIGSAVRLPPFWMFAARSSRRECR